MTTLTRNMGTDRGQPRALTSGRYQRVATTRWRAQQGIPLRAGRPSAVTPDLAVEGKSLLQAGATVSEVCDRLGVARSSWYRFVHREAEELERALRPYRVRRRTNAISPSVERQMRRLARAGLTRRAIAERLGLHPNTVGKYLGRSTSPRGQSPVDPPPP